MALYSGGYPSFLIYKNGGSPATYSVSGPSMVIDNQWHLLTGVYDSSNVILYLDGSSVNSTPAPGVTMSSTAYSFEIGGNTNGNTYHYFNGSIDDVRVYDRALSATEVVNLYNMGK